MLPLVAEASTVPGKGVNMAEGSTGAYLSRVFPYKDDNPTILTPVVTVGIIALNLAAWIFLQGAGAEGPLARSVCELGLIPGEVLGTVPAGTAVPLGPGMQCVTTGGRVPPLIRLGFFITTVAPPAYVLLGYWFLLQLLMGTVGGVSQAQGGGAFWAHVGGFVAGLALIKLFASRELMEQRQVTLPRDA